TEPPRPRKTAPPWIASIKQTPMEQPLRCTARAVPRLMARRASTATAPQWVRPRTATSMRPRTATPTRTPGAAGTRRAVVRINTTAQVIRTAPRNRAHPAGDRRKRAAAPLRGAEAAAAAGETNRRVRAAGPVEAAVVAGADAVAAVAGV